MATTIRTMDKKPRVWNTTVSSRFLKTLASENITFYRKNDFCIKKLNFCIKKSFLQWKCQKIWNFLNCQWAPRVWQAFHRPLPPPLPISPEDSPLPISRGSGGAAGPPGGGKESVRPTGFFKLVCTIGCGIVTQFIPWEYVRVSWHVILWYCGAAWRWVLGAGSRRANWTK